MKWHFSGSAGISGTRNICNKNPHWIGFNLRNGLGLGRKHLLKRNGASICCSQSTEKDPLLPSIQNLTDARLIYSVSAALGHNKVFTCYNLVVSVTFNPLLHLILSNPFAHRNHIQNAAQEFLPLLMLLRRMSSLLRQDFFFWHSSISCTYSYGSLVSLITLLRLISRGSTYLWELQCLWNVIVSWNFVGLILHLNGVRL